MDPERWRLVEGLYHSASKREPGSREAFLEDACREDADLLREVQSLLAKGSGNGFLERPAWDGDESLTETVAAVQLSSGTLLGPYRIETLLGAGGMGQVYSARDTRLDRLVAIKIMDEKFSSRFEREARAISALNHPHI